MAFGDRLSGKDISLAAANTKSTGIWSDGTTIWVADGSRDKLFAYTLATGARDSDKDFNTLGESGANIRAIKPTGVWGDGQTIWASELGATNAYNKSTGDLDAAKSFEGGSNGGIWSDGETIWFGQFGGDTLLAATLNLSATHPSDRATRDVTKDITLHKDPIFAAGIWSDGETVWVVDQGPQNSDFANQNPSIFAYTLATGKRDTTKEFDLDKSPFNISISILSVNVWGIWSDGSTVWVGQSGRDSNFQPIDKLFAYDFKQVPDPLDTGADFSATPALTAKAGLSEKFLLTGAALSASVTLTAAAGFEFRDPLMTGASISATPTLTTNAGLALVDPLVTGGSFSGGGSATAEAGLTLKDPPAKSQTWTLGPVGTSFINSQGYGWRAAGISDEQVLPQFLHDEDDVSYPTLLYMPGVSPIAISAGVRTRSSLVLRFNRNADGSGGLAGDLLHSLETMGTITIDVDGRDSYTFDLANKYREDTENRYQWTAKTVDESNALYNWMVSLRSAPGGSFTIKPPDPSLSTGAEFSATPTVTFSKAALSFDALTTGSEFLVEGSSTLAAGFQLQGGDPLIIGAEFEATPTLDANAGLILVQPLDTGASFSATPTVTVGTAGLYFDWLEAGAFINATGTSTLAAGFQIRNPLSTGASISATPTLTTRGRLRLGPKPSKTGASISATPTLTTNAGLELTGGMLDLSATFSGAGSTVAKGGLHFDFITAGAEFTVPVVSNLNGGLILGKAPDLDTGAVFHAAGTTVAKGGIFVTGGKPLNAGASILVTGTSTFNGGFPDPNQAAIAKQVADTLQTTTYLITDNKSGAVAAIQVVLETDATPGLDGRDASSVERIFAARPTNDPLLANQLPGNDWPFDAPRDPNTQTGQHFVEVGGVRWYDATPDDLNEDKPWLHTAVRTYIGPEPEANLFLERVPYDTPREDVEDDQFAAKDWTLTQPYRAVGVKGEDGEEGLGEEIIFTSSDTADPITGAANLPLATQNYDVPALSTDAGLVRGDQAYYDGFPADLSDERPYIIRFHRVVKGAPKPNTDIGNVPWTQDAAYHAVGFDGEEGVGEEYIFASSTTNKAIAGTANLPDPNWNYDQDGLAAGIKRGNQKYYDGFPPDVTQNRQWVIRFRRPIKGSPAQNEDIGNVPWTQEKAWKAFGVDGEEGLGVEYIFTSRTTSAAVTAPASLPDPNWNYDASGLATGIKRGSGASAQTYYDGTPGDLSSARPFVIRFRRPVPGAPKQDDDIGNVPWIQEAAERRIAESFDRPTVYQKIAIGASLPAKPSGVTTKNYALSGLGAWSVTFPNYDPQTEAVACTTASVPHTGSVPSSAWATVRICDQDSDFSTVYARGVTQPAALSKSMARIPTGTYAVVANVPAGPGAIWSNHGFRPSKEDDYTWDGWLVNNLQDDAQVNTYLVSKDRDSITVAGRGTNPTPNSFKVTIALAAAPNNVIQTKTPAGQRSMPSVKFTGLSDSTEYIIKAQAIYTGGTNGPVDSLRTATDEPTGLIRVQGTGPESIKATVPDAGAGATYQWEYERGRQLAGDVWERDSDTRVPEKTFTGLAPNAVYAVRYRTVIGSVTSGWTDLGRAYTWQRIGSPTPAQNVVLAIDEDGIPKVDWGAPASSTYALYSYGVRLIFLGVPVQRAFGLVAAGRSRTFDALYSAGDYFVEVTASARDNNGVLYRADTAISNTVTFAGQDLISDADPSVA